MAISGESAVFAALLEQNPILPLFYGNSISDEILSRFSYKGINAKRNGSVSGTTAEFALEITSGNVYFCGLDLSLTKGVSHTQPNELDRINALYESRLCTREAQAVKNYVQNNSMGIYRDWFCAQNFGERLFRLSIDGKFSTPLGAIRDIDFSCFRHNMLGSNYKKPELIKTGAAFNKEKRIEDLQNFINQNVLNPKWINELLPKESIILERAADKENKEKLLTEINNKAQQCIRDIKRAIN